VSSRQSAIDSHSQVEQMSSRWRTAVARSISSSISGSLRIASWRKRSRAGSPRPQTQQFVIASGRAHHAPLTSTQVEVKRYQRAADDPTDIAVIGPHMPVASIHLPARPRWHNIERDRWGYPAAPQRRNCSPATSPTDRRGRQRRWRSPPRTEHASAARTVHAPSASPRLDREPGSLPDHHSRVTRPRWFLLATSGREHG
jgi:hypothetical protein